MRETKLVEEDGFNFLNEVRVTLDDSRKYEDFLCIMREFRYQRISIEVLVVRIKELFRGKWNLIMGINDFLPKKHKIEIGVMPRKPMQIEDALQFIQKFKAVDAGQTYKEFLGIMNLYRRGETSFSTFYQEVSMLLKEHCELLEEFKHVLPCYTTVPPLKHGTAQRSLSEDMSPRVAKMERISTHSDTVADPSTSSHGKDSLHMEEPSAKEKFDRREQFDNAVSDACHVTHQAFFLSNGEEDDEINNPSYHILQINHETPPFNESKGKESLPDTTEKEKAVLKLLNKDVAIKRSTEDYSSKQRKKSQVEEILFQCEDDRFEMDLLTERMKATEQQMDLLTSKSLDHLNIEDHLNEMHLRCVEQIYGDHGQDMVDLLKRSPVQALPVILRRIKQKEEEFMSFRSNIDRIWANVFVGNHCKSRC